MQSLQKTNHPTWAKNNFEFCHFGLVVVALPESCGSLGESCESLGRLAVVGSGFGRVD